jgi:hypothetical protein
MNALARNFPMITDGSTDYREWRRVTRIPAMAPPSTSYGSNRVALQAAIATMNVPIVARFRRLANQWIKETENMSSIQDIVSHPAYQEIIGMGPAVIALLIDELEREPNHWFSALHAVSGGQNPVPPEHAGDLDEMVKAWRDWAGANGYR